MAWITPSIGDLRRLCRDFISAYLPGADATVPNSNMRVLSDANAGVAALNLQYLAYLAGELLPDTAVDWLDRHAQIWLGGAKSATYAAGAAAVTGSNGTVLPLATRMGATNGCEYETTAQITIGTGPTQVALRSLFPGAQGNQAAGSKLTVSVAISGVDASATVVDLTGGTDTESVDSVRERILARIRQPPMGGDADDYVAWARALPGVSRAWCAPKEMGPGTVTVRIMMDELRSGSGGFPLESDLAASRVSLDAVRPVAVKDFFLLAPIAEVIPYTVTDLDPDTSATRAALEASVNAMIATRAAPAHAIGGILQDAQTIHREWVSAAILDAAGVYSFNLVMDDHPMPTSGHMATVGVPTFA